jgi:hypothetical protein
MKILVPFALLLLSGCMSVERLGPYELAPARNPPSMTVQPVSLQAVYRASGCAGSVTNGVCHESTSPDGEIAANVRGGPGN